ncbi:hypothetical protein KY290_028795 [Solanum tuberosum]|nr:hypothetical protein KY284_027789 [Solanum tuberosum]KAH0749563.1 hypothetical protein KY290_028795 [Solanum tuberosum]
MQSFFTYTSFTKNHEGNKNVKYITACQQQGTEQNGGSGVSVEMHKPGRTVYRRTQLRRRGSQTVESKGATREEHMIYLLWITEEQAQSKDQPAFSGEQNEELSGGEN